MAAAGDRIEQFRKMANDDPNNEVAHFSLGREYLAVGRYEEAAAELARCVQLNPNVSKAWQLHAEAMLRLNRREVALQLLTAGIRHADERGDFQPRDEMIRMLTEAGGTVPELKSASKPAEPVGEGMVRCARCRQTAPKLPRQPFKGPVGAEIFEKICADCWRQWIPMGTKVINELRLPLNDPQAQKMYDQHMLEFLNLR